MTDLHELPAYEIGRRLRVARENAEKRREEAAAVIESSVRTIVAIENGEQIVGINELPALAKFYGKSVSSILRREAVFVNLIPRFRRLNESQPESVIEAAKILNDLVSAEIELENHLGIKHIKKYPAVKSIDSGDIETIAERQAMEVRDWLDIGSGPIADIFSLIENKIGIRLYQRKLASSISGLFVFDESVGACILLNSAHPLRRRVYSAAHELGHFIGTRHSPETLEKGERFSSREEQYADSFARSFLTPRDSFTEVFRSLSVGADSLSRRHIILLAVQFGISHKFCVRRLEQLELVQKGTWNWFEENGKITREHVCELLGRHYEEVDWAKVEAKKPVPYRIRLLATMAWEQDLVSEGLLSELLRIHRIPLREIFYENQSEQEANCDVLKFLNR